MSLRSDNRYHCDRCGRELTGSSVSDATMIVMLTVAEGEHAEGSPTPLQLQLCTDPVKGAPHGCTGRVLTEKALADFLTARDAGRYAL